jgi:hypothetical protein
MSVAAYKYKCIAAARPWEYLACSARRGSVRTSMAQTIQERREQFHLSRLVDGLSPLNPQVQELLDGARGATTLECDVRFCVNRVTRPIAAPARRDDSTHLRNGSSNSARSWRGHAEVVSTRF